MRSLGVLGTPASRASQACEEPGISDENLEDANASQEQSPGHVEFQVSLLSGMTADIASWLV